MEITNTNNNAINTNTKDKREHSSNNEMSTEDKDKKTQNERQVCPDGRYKRSNKIFKRHQQQGAWFGQDQDEGLEVVWFTIYQDSVTKEDLKQIREVNRLMSEEANAEQRKQNLTFVKEWVNKERNEIQLIAELDGGINLHEFIKTKDTIQKKVALKQALQILQGLRFFHEYKLPMQNLSTDNCFICPNKGRVKLGFQGCSINGRQLVTASEILGCPFYSKPSNNPEADWLERSRYDIYRYGLILLEIFTCKLPFEDLNQSKLFERENFPLLLLSIKDQGVFDIIASCLQMQPTKRPTLVELIEMVERESSRADNLSQPVNLCKEDEIVDLYRQVKSNEFVIISKEEYYMKKAKIKNMQDYSQLTTTVKIKELNGFLNHNENYLLGNHQLIKKDSNKNDEYVNKKNEDYLFKLE